MAHITRVENTQEYMTSKCLLIYILQVTLYMNCIQIEKV